MPQAARAQTSFLGGIWSGSAQGRFDDPAYATAMSVCLNGFPIETGAWTRRPGTQFAQTTRGGAVGRVFKYDFNGAAPYWTEFTSLTARFRSGPNLITTNDSVAVSAISGATPAVVQTASATGWSSTNTVFFPNSTDPQLLNRQFLMTVVDGTHFSLVDAITGAALNGTLLQSFTSLTVSRVHEVTTPYGVVGLSAIRFIQADAGAFLVHPTIAPQLITPTQQPTPTMSAQFQLTAVNFLDGPYLDPVPGGALVTPSATSGSVQLTMSFPAYSSSQAYQQGAFVTSSNVNYESLINNNLNNTPASSPTAWKAVSPGIAIGPNGFQQTDIGRLIRLFSEPPVWVSGTAYTATTSIVSYLDPDTGAYSYYTCLTSHTASASNAPGLSATDWGLSPNVAVWTWGIITSLINGIATTGGSTFGNMTLAGGLAAAFNGNTSQVASASAELIGTQEPTSTTAVGYVGYHLASSSQVASAIVYPASDNGFSFSIINGVTVGNTVPVTLSLYGSNSLPSSATNGTLLGTTVVPAGQLTPATINSSNQATSYAYLWVVASATITSGNAIVNVDLWIAQVQFTSPAGTGTGTGIDVSIIGTPLLYTSAIRVWRLGAYSGSTGYPSCGTWHEGRLWLGGAIANRFDASVVNGFDPTTGTLSVNMSPTAPDGTVGANNGMSYTLNAPDVSQIQAFVPDAQGIYLLTQSGEWLLSATAADNILTPTSIQAHRVTRIGCANIEPRRTDHTVIFVQKHQRDLMEGFADVFSGKFTAPNLAERCRALTQSGIQEVAYQQQLYPIVWARLGNGSLIGCTYRRTSLMTAQGPTFAAFHQHALGSGRTVVSICDSGSVDGTLDSLGMVTLDASTGIYHVEIMTNIFEDGSPITSAWFLDDAVVPAYSLNMQTMTLTLSGLWHLNGKTVQAMVGGLDAGDKSGRNAGPFSDFTVSNGQITIQFDGSQNPLLTMTFIQSFIAGGGMLPVVVGFTYTSQAQMLRLAEQKESGSADGPAFGKVSRTAQFMALLQDTQGIKFGSLLTSTLHPANFRLDNNVPYAPNTLWSGVYWDSLHDAHSRTNPQFCWQVTRPLPATVCAVSTKPETNG